MKLTTLLLALFAMMVFAWGCKKTKEQPPNDSFIEGEVIHFATKQPIEGITVNLFSTLQHDWWGTTYFLDSTKTDKDGKYHFAYSSTKVYDVYDIIVRANNLDGHSSIDSNYGNDYIYFHNSDVAKRTIVADSLVLQEYIPVTINFIHDRIPISPNDTFDFKITEAASGYTKIFENNTTNIIQKHLTWGFSTPSNKVMITVIDHKPGIAPITNVDSTYFYYKQPNIYNLHF